MRPIACGLVLAALLAGCSQGGEPPALPQAEDGTHHVAMRDARFQPDEASVPQGATLRFISEDGPHDVDVYKRGEEFGRFNSNNPPPDGLGRLIGQGEHFDVRLAEPGRYIVFCHTHHEEGMRMDILVK